MTLLCKIEQYVYFSSSYSSAQASFVGLSINLLSMHVFSAWPLESHFFQVYGASNEGASHQINYLQSSLFSLLAKAKWEKVVKFVTPQLFLAFSLPHLQAF